MISEYSPSIHWVCDFLTEKGNQEEVYEYVCAFLVTLFNHATQVVNDKWDTDNIAVVHEKDDKRANLFVSK